MPSEREKEVIDWPSLSKPDGSKSNLNYKGDLGSKFNNINKYILMKMKV